jgi:two-component system sensor histidine kinase YesM
LVENSILHGFKDRTSGGTIDIHISQENHLLYLRIEDNGTGMNMEKVQQGLIETGNTKKGYALRNIMHRLQLYYGNEARMEMNTNEGGGSRMELWIPLNEEEYE